MDVIEILDIIIFMAQRTKEALEQKQIPLNEYETEFGHYLNEAYRAMSFAAIHEGESR